MDAYDIYKFIENHEIDIDPDITLEECVWSYEQKSQHDSQKRERVYTLFMNSCFGHLITTESGRITDINNAMLHILGYTQRHEVKYKSVINFIHPDDVHPQRKFVEEVVEDIQKGNKFRNVRYRHREGHYIQCRTSVVVSKDHNEDTFVLAYIRIPEEDAEVQ